MSFSDLLQLPVAWVILLLLVVGLIGSCFGSFINCLSWRMTHGQSIMRGRSHCPSCQHVLEPIDLVPVFSWIMQRGRCRYCNTHISARYLATELLLGIYFVSILLVYGLTFKTCAFWILGCVLLGLSLVDLETYQIPNGFILAGLLTWIVTFAFFGVDAGSYTVGRIIRPLVGSDWLAVLVDGLIGAFAVAGVLLLIALLFDRVVGRRSLGGGDVKLVFMVGLYLGLAASVLNVIVSCFIGIAFALFTQKERADNENPKAFPFGPSVAVATWLTLLFGSPLIGAYLSLL